MKNLLLTLVLLNVSIGFSQHRCDSTSTTKYYGKLGCQLFDTLRVKLDKYCVEEKTPILFGLLKIKNSKIADDYAFNKQINNIFNYAVVGNNDAVNNGSAFSYSHDKDKHKFSANFTYAGKYWKRTLLEIGTNIASSDEKYEYYSKNKWANDVGIKIGLSWRLWAGQRTYSDKCDSINNIRKSAILKKEREIQKAINRNISYADLKTKLKDTLDKEQNDIILDIKADAKTALIINAMSTDLQILKKLDKLFKANDGKQHEIVQHSSYPKVITVKALSDVLGISMNKARGILKSLKTGGPQGATDIFLTKTLTTNAQVDDFNKKVVRFLKINEFTSKMLSEFDEKNNIFHGYSVAWANVSLNTANSALKIKNDSIIEKEFQQIYSGRLKSTLEASFNYNRVGQNSIQFFKLFSSFNRGSFLDSPNLRDLELNVVLDTITESKPIYNIVDKDGTVKYNYNKIRDSKYNIDLGFYYASMFMFQKQFGLSLKAVHNFPVGRKLEMLYGSNYSLLLGTIFRKNTESAWSKATFAINGGFENQIYETKVWQNFILKASVGIPFSIFEKPKEEKK